MLVFRLYRKQICPAGSIPWLYPPAWEKLFSMSGEAATTEITRVDDAQGFRENKKAARKGGEVAGRAREDLERKTRKKVVSPVNFLEVTQKRQKQLKGQGN